MSTDAPRRPPRRAPRRAPADAAGLEAADARKRTQNSCPRRARTRRATTSTHMHDARPTHMHDAGQVGDRALTSSAPSTPANCTQQTNCTQLALTHRVDHTPRTAARHTPHRTALHRTTTPTHTRTTQPPHAHARRTPPLATPPHPPALRRACACGGCVCAWAWSGCAAWRRAVGRSGGRAVGRSGGRAIGRSGGRAVGRSGRREVGTVLFPCRPRRAGARRGARRSGRRGASDGRLMRSPGLEPGRWPSTRNAGGGGRAGVGGAGGRGVAAEIGHTRGGKLEVALTL